MTAKTTLLVFMILIFTDGAYAAKCKFENNEGDHVESRNLILFRGVIVGLMGNFGIENGQHYFRGFFGSNFKARASFSEDTPLELTLADGNTLSLAVVTEAISSKLKFGHIITVSRDAHPVFSITPGQWSELLASPIVRLHMPFDVNGERQSETRDVKNKHGQRIVAALQCVTDAMQQGETP